MCFTFWSLDGRGILSLSFRMDRRFGRNKYNITAQINSIDKNMKSPPLSEPFCMPGNVGSVNGTINIELTLFPSPQKMKTKTIQLTIEAFRIGTMSLTLPQLKFVIENVAMLNLRTDYIKHMCLPKLIVFAWQTRATKSMHTHPFHRPFYLNSSCLSLVRRLTLSNAIFNPNPDE